MQRRDTYELESAFYRGRMNRLPNGFGRGKAIAFSGRNPIVRGISRALDGAIGWIWQGKNISSDGASLTNRLFSRKDRVDARIRPGDHGRHWVLDYRRSAFLPARILHDEVRMVDDQTALGKVYFRLGRWKWFTGTYFLLQFDGRTNPEPNPTNRVA